ncbi:MAG TPA: hypothetical protein PL110_14190 [Candidatus Eremiobacteraeota bacterium]|nr:MAG: hypothetical protein BWY64_02644 [bacterium ADurb.Bin363]HPZ09255.1 hypothetical protein [Candidatus Eremiobacteraeota bacterium]
MEQRIDRIEKLIEELAESRKSDRALIERHDKILANLELNQIIMGKAIVGIEKSVEGIEKSVSGIREDIGRMARAMNDFIDAVGFKFKDHEERINKLEGK